VPRLLFLYCTMEGDRPFWLHHIQKDAENHGEEDEPLKQTRSLMILEKRGKLSCY
jgi:hypothetical protein